MITLTNSTIVRINEITFDLSTDDDSIPEEHMNQVQKELQEEYLNSYYVLEQNETLDDVVNQISDECGWCIQSIDLEEVK